MISHTLTRDEATLSVLSTLECLQSRIDTSRKVIEGF
jgi:hypothetical protein